MYLKELRQSDQEPVFVAKQAWREDTPAGPIDQQVCYHHIPVGTPEAVCLSWEGCR